MGRSVAQCSARWGVPSLVQHAPPRHDRYGIINRTTHPGVLPALVSQLRQISIGARVWRKEACVGRGISDCRPARRPWALSGAACLWVHLPRQCLRRSRAWPCRRPLSTGSAMALRWTWRAHVRARGYPGLYKLSPVALTSIVGRPQLRTFTRLSVSHPCRCFVPTLTTHHVDVHSVPPISPRFVTRPALPFASARHYTTQGCAAEKLAATSATWVRTIGASRCRGGSAGVGKFLPWSGARGDGPCARSVEATRKATWTEGAFFAASQAIGRRHVPAGRVLNFNAQLQHLGLLNL